MFLHQSSPPDHVRPLILFGFAFEVVDGALDPESLSAVRDVAVPVESFEAGAQFRKFGCATRLSHVLPRCGRVVLRDVPFPAWLYYEPQELRAWQSRQARSLGALWRDYDLVFASPTGAPRDPHGLAGRLRRLLKAAGLPDPYTLYSPRHTYATLQFLAGERDKVVSDLMGHVRVDFTKQFYMKVLPVMHEQASDNLERLLFADVRTTLAQPDVERVM